MQDRSDQIGPPPRREDNPLRQKKIELFALLSIFGDGPVLSRSIFFHKFALITPERSEGFPPPPQLSSPDFYKLRSVYGLS